MGNIDSRLRGGGGKRGMMTSLRFCLKGVVPFPYMSSGAEFYLLCRKCVMLPSHSFFSFLYIFLIKFNHFPGQLFNI